MEGLKNFHKDVLLAMVNALTEQFSNGRMSEVNYSVQLTPIMSELYDRQDARLREMEAAFRQLRADQVETERTNAMIVGIYDLYLSMKGLGEDFEAFEHEWMMKHGR